MVTTAYKVQTIDVSTSSPDLAPLAGRSYERQYTSLPNANLPKAMRQSLDKVFLALTGEELPLEENTFLIKAENGVYSRLFGPILKSGSDEVEGTRSGAAYIQWGPRYIPVQLGKEGMTVEVGGNPVTMEAEFGEFNFSGRGNDVALMVSIDEEDGSGQIVLPVAVRFTDYQNPTDVKVLNSQMKKNNQDFILDLISTVAARNSGGGLSKADHEIDFRDLEEGDTYLVTGYRSCNTTYGTSYRITLANYPVEGQTAECWAHTSLRPLLATQPEISEENPATLNIKSKQVLSDGKTSMRCSLILSQQVEVSEDDLNLNF